MKQVTRAGFSAALAFSLVVVPLGAMAQENSGQSLSELIKAREEKAQSQAQQPKKRGLGGIIADALPFVAGIGTSLFCGGFDRNNSTTERAGCIALGALVGYGAYELKKSIRKKINDKEQAELLVAAGDSLADGQPRSLAFPESNATGSVATAGEVFFKDTKADMFFDSLTLASRERVQVIAQPYLTTGNANLRSMPTTDGSPVKTFASDTPLHVVGQVPDQDWYMVSQLVSEGDDEALMVVGYMSASLLKPAPDDLRLTPLPAPKSVQIGEFDVALRCDEVVFQVRDEKGKLGEEKASNCIGPEGQLVSA